MFFESYINKLKLATNSIENTSFLNLNIEECRNKNEFVEFFRN